MSSYRVLTGPGRKLWRENRIDVLLAEHDDGALFVAGCVSNQVTFYPRFDAVVLLSAPLDVILERVASRETNAYGKTDTQRAEIVHYLATVEPLLRGRARPRRSTPASRSTRWWMSWSSSPAWTVVRTLGRSHVVRTRIVTREAELRSARGSAARSTTVHGRRWQWAADLRKRVGERWSQSVSDDPPATYLPRMERTLSKVTWTRTEAPPPPTRRARRRRRTLPLHRCGGCATPCGRASRTGRPRTRRAGRCRRSSARDSE